jgi:hypothetical protein
MVKRTSFFAARFFAGTFPPDLRASERSIAIACFLLFTAFPNDRFYEDSFVKPSLITA